MLVGHALLVVVQVVALTMHRHPRGVFKTIPAAHKLWWKLAKSCACVLLEGWGCAGKCAVERCSSRWWPSVTLRTVPLLLPCGRSSTAISRVLATTKVSSK